MKCEIFQENISLFLDGLQSPGENAALFEHLGGCETCREFFDSVLSVRNAVRRIPEPEFSSARDAQIRDEIMERRTADIWKKRFTFSLPAAAVFVLLMIGGLVGTSLHFIEGDSPDVPASHTIIYISEYPEIEILPINDFE